MNIKEILQGIKSWAVGKFGSTADVAAILGKIPTQASTSNQLADKAFVNSSVQTSTANFRGSWQGFGDVPNSVGDYPPDYAGSKTPTVNDYMVVLDCSANEWVSGDSFMTGDIVKVTTDLGTDGLFRCKEDIENTITPMDDPDHWEPLPDDWFKVARLSHPGTWRFKYVGNWDTLGVQGWLPEYQVNEEPLTAAQIAALNSNMTANLVAKITKATGVSGDLLGTASQTLTEAEKEQARMNIGATAPEVFWATYGTTTAAEIDAAVSAGKVVLCKDSNLIYILVSDLPGATFKYFYAAAAQVTKRLSVKNADSSWKKATINLQEANIVTNWQETPDNMHYPAEKLVYEELQAIKAKLALINVIEVDMEGESYLEIDIDDVLKYESADILNIDGETYKHHPFTGTNVPTDIGHYLDDPDFPEFRNAYSSLHGAWAKYAHVDDTGVIEGGEFAVLGRFSHNQGEDKYYLYKL